MSDIAKKNDAGKPDYTFVTKELMDACARGMGYGAAKYDRANFKKGMQHTRLAAACLRHIFLWLAGEDIDAESGNNHIDHAISTLNMLAYSMHNHPTLDDRDHKRLSGEYK